MSFTEILSPFTYYEYEKLGCFKDSEARAVPSLEGQDPLLDDDYTRRQDAVRKCALAAKKREHKVYVVMSDGRCSSGADTEKSFAKFGHGENVCSTLVDIHRVYNYNFGSVDGMIYNFTILTPTKYQTSFRLKTGYLHTCEDNMLFSQVTRSTYNKSLKLYLNMLLQ